MIFRNVNYCTLKLLTNNDPFSMKNFDSRYQSIPFHIKLQKTSNIYEKVFHVKKTIMAIEAKLIPENPGLCDRQFV